MFLFLDYQCQGRKNRPEMRLAWRKGVHTTHCKPLVALENSGCSRVRRHSENIVVFVVLERQSQSLLSCRLQDNLSRSWQGLIPEPLEARLRRKFRKSSSKMLRWNCFPVYYHIERGFREKLIPAAEMLDIKSDYLPL